MISYNPLHNCVHLAIDNALNNYEKYKTRLGFINYRKAFVQECLTYHIRFPRLSGHSTAIKECINYYAEIRPSAIFLPTIHFIRGFQRDVPKDCLVLCAKSIYDDKLRGIRINSMFVDCASLISNAQKDKIIEHACNQPDLKFLMFLE